MFHLVFSIGRGEVHRKERVTDLVSVTSNVQVGLSACGGSKAVLVFRI